VDGGGGGGLVLPPHVPESKVLHNNFKLKSRFCALKKIYIIETNGREFNE